VAALLGAGYGRGWNHPQTEAGSAPFPARGACGRAAPPSALSAASRRPHTLPPLGREREPPPPSRAGGRCSAPELDFTAHPPLGLTPSPVGHTGRGSSFGGLSAAAALRPLRLARVKVGGASRAARSQGPAPALNPTPPPPRAELPAEALPRAGNPLAEPEALPRGPAHRPQAAFGAQGPLRRPPRRRGGPASRAASSAPPLWGSRLLRRGGGRGGARA